MHLLKSPTFKFQNRSLGHPAPKGILAEKLHVIISCPSFVLEGNSRVGVVWNHGRPPWMARDFWPNYITDQPRSTLSWTRRSFAIFRTGALWRFRGATITSGFYCCHPRRWQSRNPRGKIKLKAVNHSRRAATNFEALPDGTTVETFWLAPAVHMAQNWRSPNIYRLFLQIDEQHRRLP